MTVRIFVEKTGAVFQKKKHKGTYILAQFYLKEKRINSLVVQTAIFNTFVAQHSPCTPLPPSWIWEGNCWPSTRTVGSRVFLAARAQAWAPGAPLGRKRGGRGGGALRLVLVPAAESLSSLETQRQLIDAIFSPENIALLENIASWLIAPSEEAERLALNVSHLPPAA